MVPLFRDLGEVLEKASQPIAKALRQYNRITSRFLITLKDAILFYVGAVRLIRRFQEAGLPVCRPEIAPADERICQIEGCVNANLAIHLLNRGRDDLSGAIVPNDVTFDDTGRIIVLTGPNRGGKTTYIQAIGLAQVMAQAGLYVPGRWARISPVDGIYTHYPVEERLERDTGRFGDEARRLHEVFARVTPYSLVLLNESLSSTNPGESLYLARDLIRVLRMVGARAVFVTHLHELAEDVDRLNDETPGDSRIVSMVASRITPDMLAELDGEAEAARSYRVVHSPPVGRSFARQIATRYGVSYEQLIDLLRSRGVLP
jgi:DNA mismatch repair protein MutS